MADIPTNIPGTPGGAVPPLKKETGKVQPKKETVRINLPPKPSTAPTIKMPTLPPGGPTGAASVPPPAVPIAAPAPMPIQAHAAPRATTIPAAPPRPAPVVQRAAPTTVATVGALDQILAIAVMLAGLFAVGSVLYLMFGISTGN
jgi:hypothetical protein